MKRNRLFAILIAATMLCLSSCTREVIGTSENSVQEGAPITVDLSFSLPEGSPETKAMGAGEAIKNVYVAVFSGSHYLNQFAKALPLTQSLDASGTTIQHVSLDTDGVTPKYVKDDVSGKYHIRVTLAQSGSSSNPRYIHVLANVDEANLPDFNAYENEVMTEKLFTKDTQEGYWTYILMPDGITQSELDTKFKNLTLVRNYATIKLVVSDSSELEILGFDVYNVPSKGTFAAYTGSGTKYYTGFDPAKSYTNTVKDYAGWHPDSWALKTTVPDTFSGEGTAPKYVFEQPADKVHSLTDPANTSAFIVAKIRKSDHTEHYYRIDLVDNNGERVSVLRNFDYTVTVGNIGITGYDKASDAAQHPSFNVTMDPITQAATEISNGSAIMRVEYVEKVYTQAVEGAKFKYQYLSDASNPSSNMAGAVSAVTGSSITPKWTAGASGSQEDGWFEITYDVKKPADVIPAGETQVSSTFKVVAGTGPDKIQRVITIITMGKNDFTVKDGTYTYNPSTRTLTFTLHIPGGLPSSIFPLQIMFEDSNQAMSPQVSGFISTAGKGLKKGDDDKIQFQKNFRWASYNSSAGSDIKIELQAQSTAPVHGTIYVKDRENMFNMLEVTY